MTCAPRSALLSQVENPSPDSPVAATRTSEGAFQGLASDAPVSADSMEADAQDLVAALRVLNAPPPVLTPDYSGLSFVSAGEVPLV